jgi:hypothetical protein
LHPDPTKRSTALSAPPTSLGTYYKKYYNAQGLNIVGTASASDVSMNIIYKQIDNMISAIINPAYRAKFSGLNIIVMSKYDDQTKMPLMSMISASDLQTHRGFASPFVTLLEEVICQVGSPESPEDKLYRGMDIPVHEFGHMIASVLNLNASYNSVIAINNLNPDPTWPNDEYWAHAVQDWYSQEHIWLWDSSTKWWASTPTPLTRADLMTKAPAMHTYMKSVFAIDDSKYLVNCSDFGLPMK